MKNKNKFFAARGRGFGFHSKSSPMGSLDDMFFIYNSKFIKKSKLFEFDALQQLPHIQNSHGIIVSNLVTKVGPNNVHIYSDTSKLYFYKNKLILGFGFNNIKINFIRKKQTNSNLQITQRPQFMIPNMR